MALTFRPRTLVLFFGDILALALSLWLSLYLREFSIPTEKVLVAHALPFSLLFIVWIVVFFIAGLYESKSILLARRSLSATLLVAQCINMVLAALFFFFIPLFGIAPKALLGIYLIISFIAVLLWRATLYPWLGLQKGEPTLVVGDSAEMQELVAALKGARHAPARVVAMIAPGAQDLTEEVVRTVARERPRFIIADFTNSRVATAFPQLYNFLLKGIRFFDASAVYEEMFGRVPLSLVDERWLARHISLTAHRLYDPLKRSIDIIAAVICGALTLPLYPFIMCAILSEGGGGVWIAQQRIGKGGVPFTIYKFRTMTGDDGGSYGVEGKTKLRVTRVGYYLRISRLDELPQLWNVLIGTMSIIGPRPEVPALVSTYTEAIPFYAVRHLIKPGLSGSAQLYYHGDPHHAADVESTKMKLSYDLFYLKHRSLTLDLSIAIKTIRRILTKSNA